MMSNAVSQSRFWLYIRYAATIVALRPGRRILYRGYFLRNVWVELTHACMTMHQNPSPFIQLCLYECDRWKKMDQDVCVLRIV